MGHRAKPLKDKTEAKRPHERKPAQSDGTRGRDHEKRVAEARGQLQTSNRERAEAQEQQAATAEILRVISSSPTDVQPVFDTIVKSALKLCDGFFSIVYGFDGEIM